MKYFLFLMLILLPECYKDYRNFNIDYEPAVYNEDSTAVAFMRFTRVSKPARGAMTFPDGGRPKVLYNDVSLFYYPIGADSLIKVIGFGDLVYNKTRWRSCISFAGNYLAFSIQPIIVRRDYMNDNALYQRLNVEFKGIFIYNILQNKLVKWKEQGEYPIFSPKAKQLVYFITDSLSHQILLADIKGNTKVLCMADSVNFYSLQWIGEDAIACKMGSNWYKIDLKTAKERLLTNDSLKIIKNVGPTAIKKLMEHIPIIKQEPDLLPFLPQNKSEGIQALVELKGNDNFRKALFQELEKDLTKKDIEKILKGIEKHKANIGGYDRILYNNAMQETVSQLKALHEK